MHIISSVFIVLWIWEFLRVRISRVPDWIIHVLIIPSISYMSWIVPEPYGYILSVSGIILFIYMIFIPKTSVAESTRRTRRSNIPPPP